MIDWLIQTGFDTGILICIVLLIRNPVRKYLGANIAYWLWLIPFVRLFVWQRAELSLPILEKVNLPMSNDIFPIVQIPHSFDYISIDFGTAIWVMGMFVLLLKRSMIWLKFKQSLETSRIRLTSSEIKEIYPLLKEGLKTKFYVTTNPLAPFVTGLFNTDIYLSRKFYEDYSKSSQNLILTHEITHLKRKDLWVQFIAEVYRILFWFNPLAHIAFHVLKQDQELACDYQVLAKLNQQQRYEYGRLLLNSIRDQKIPATMAFFINYKQRFIMLEKHNNSNNKKMLGLLLCSIFMLFAFTTTPISNDSIESNIREILPKQIIINSIQNNSKLIVIKGHAKEVTLITRYMQQLGQVILPNPVLKSMEKGSDNWSFVINLKYKIND